MRYRSFIVILFLFCTFGCAQKQQSAAIKAYNSTQSTLSSLDTPMKPNDSFVEKTDAEWKKQLSPEQYEVTRKKGTERAFTGQYWNNKEKGSYKCVCCGEELFTSTTKYDSGCGWPSFYAPANDEIIKEEKDLSYGMVRVEVMCSKCGAHLGHVFEDGPRDKGGLRYCINSASLEFEKDSSQTPKLKLNR